MLMKALKVVFLTFLVSSLFAEENRFQAELSSLVSKMKLVPVLD